MNRYGRFFLVYEEDEEITVKPNKRSIDYTADIEPTEDAGDTDEDDTDDGQVNDNVEDTPTEDDVVDTELEDDTDYTANIPDEPVENTDTGVDEPTEDSTATDDTAPPKLKPGLEYDSTRKYKLFCRFDELLDTCDAFLERLQKMTTDSQDTSKVIDNGITKIVQIRKLVHDYMILRFELDSYVQAMLYYDKLIVILNEVLNNMKIISKISDK